MTSQTEGLPLATPDAGHLLAQALQLHQHGQLGAAEALYQDVLRIAPWQPDAHHLLGVLDLQGGRPADAVTRIRHAVALCPDSPVYQTNLGVALQAAGQPGQARHALERAIQLNPEYADALFNLGVTLQTLEALDEAAAHYRRVLTLLPEHPGALRNLGNTLRSLGRHAEAVEVLQRALGAMPGDPGLLSSLGTTLVDLENVDEAIAVFGAAVAQAPNDPDAWVNLASALHKAVRLDDAVEAYQQGLTLRPDHVESWQSMGRAFVRADGTYTSAERTAPGPVSARTTDERVSAAIDCHQRALALLDAAEDSTNATLRLSILRDLVETLFLAEMPAEAAAHLRTMVTLEPENVDAWRDFGIALASSGAIEESAAALDRALDLDPSNATTRSMRIFVLDVLPTTTPELAFKERRVWNDLHAAPLAARMRPHTNTPDPDRRLRVGYVSADFRRHSAATTYLSIMEAHDPAAVEIVCYAGNFHQDAHTERFKALASVWRPMRGISDAELVEQIRADGIDVLVDLSSHSGGNRLPAFAEKPAPIQVTGWGYATGTGLDVMDAFFADPVVVPPEDRRWFSEEVVDLPNVITYTPLASPPPVEPPPCLTAGVITFGSYNRAIKITPGVLETWAQVLLAVPGSRLALKPMIEDTPAHRERFLGPLMRNGIDPERVEILPFTAPDQHLGTYRGIDIQLDPFPHTGGVTTLDALMMGVPVVTLLGDRIPGRLSASFLTAVGLGDLVATTLDEYVEIAARLARAPDRLVQVRSTLRDRLLASPILDGQQYARAVEAAYRTLWRRWCATQGVS